MSRLGLFTSLFLVACNGGIGVTDAGLSSSSSTTPSTSGPPGGSSSGTGVPTTGDEASGTAGATGGTSTGTTTSTSTGPGAPTTGSTGEPSTGAVSSGPSTGDPSTGEPVGCVDVSGDYGDCDAVIGYGFDGETCRAFSGCDCAPNCDLFSPDPLTCATACAAAGECDEAKIKAAGIASDPVQVGSFCDQVDACAEAGGPLVMWLVELFPNLPCEPGFPCPTQSCHLQQSGMITAEQWSKLCAASLLPGAELRCVVWGP